MKKSEFMELPIGDGGKMVNNWELTAEERCRKLASFLLHSDAVINHVNVEKAEIVFTLYDKNGQSVIINLGPAEFKCSAIVVF
jgi:hypothetical protein